jgi:hypothetical protein
VACTNSPPIQYVTEKLMKTVDGTNHTFKSTTCSSLLPTSGRISKYCRFPLRTKHPRSLEAALISTYKCQ